MLVYISELVMQLCCSYQLVLFAPIKNTVKIANSRPLPCITIQTLNQFVNLKGTCCSQLHHILQS